MDMLLLLFLFLLCFYLFLCFCLQKLHNWTVALNFEIYTCSSRNQLWIMTVDNNPITSGPESTEVIFLYLSWHIWQQQAVRQLIQVQQKSENITWLFPVVSQGCSVMLFVSNTDCNNNCEEHENSPENPVWKYFCWQVKGNWFNRWWLQ